MYRTMDGVEVYDKHDVDAIVTPIQQAAASAKQTAESIDSRKFNTSDATREFAADRDRLSTLEEGKANKSEVSSELSADRTRLTDLENSKVNKSELTSLVNSAVDSLINSKMASVESDINHIVNNAVDQELANYDNSNTVDNKIAAAIDNIPANPAAMTPAEATALINSYF